MDSKPLYLNAPQTGSNSEHKQYEYLEFTLGSTGLEEVQQRIG